MEKYRGCWWATTPHSRLCPCDKCEDWFDNFMENYAETFVTEQYLKGQVAKLEMDIARLSDSFAEALIESDKLKRSLK